LLVVIRCPQGTYTQLFSGHCEFGYGGRGNVGFEDNIDVHRKSPADAW
jgi:hypothetical protein